MNYKGNTFNITERKPTLVQQNICTVTVFDIP